MILNDRVTNKFSLVSRHMTHGKDMLNTNWAVSIHVTEQMLMGYRTVYLDVCLAVWRRPLSYLVSFKELLVGMTLEGLRHHSAEPWTVFTWRPQQL